MNIFFSLMYTLKKTRFALCFSSHAHKSRPALVVQIMTSAAEHAKHWYFTEAKSTEAALTQFLAHNIKDFMKALSLMGTFLNP